MDGEVGLDLAENGRGLLQVLELPAQLIGGIQRAVPGGVISAVLMGDEPRRCQLVMGAEKFQRLLSRFGFLERGSPPVQHRWSAGHCHDVGPLGNLRPDKLLDLPMPAAIGTADHQRLRPLG